MPVAEEGMDKTTFNSHAGTYRLDQMLFGLMNASKTFQRAMDIVNNKYTQKSCLMYPDGIIVF